MNDFGSELLNGVGTYGGSIIGDAVNDFSPNTAQHISNITNGAISPTSQEYKDSNKN